MGYYTDFAGTWDVSPPLTPNHRAYLDAFCKSRRQSYQAEVVAGLPDPLRLATGLPVGEDGCFFVNETAASSHWRLSGIELEPPSLVAETKAIKDANKPPDGQPGLWCGWYPNSDGTEIYGEDGKFYDYVEWAQYLVRTFLEPWGYKLNGTIEWSGEDREDIGRLIFNDNALTVKEGQIEWVTTSTWTP